MYDDHGGQGGSVEEVGLGAGALHDGVGVVTVLAAQGGPDQVAPVALIEVETQGDHVAVTVDHVARGGRADGGTRGQDVELLVGRQHRRAGRDRVIDVA